jgi:hypothetical protein
VQEADGFLASDENLMAANQIPVTDVLMAVFYNLCRCLSNENREQINLLPPAGCGATF